MTGLLDLPNELLGRILAMALAPTYYWEMASHRSQRQSDRPSSRLRSDILNLSACRKLHNLALDSYFMHNQLIIYIGHVFAGALNKDGTRVFKGPTPIERGSFEQHPLFERNTRELRVEVRGMSIADAAPKLEEIAVSCHKLVKLTVCHTVYTVCASIGREELQSRIESLNEAREKAIELIFV